MKCAGDFCDNILDGPCSFFTLHSSLTGRAQFSANSNDNTYNSGGNEYIKYQDIAIDRH